MKTSKQKALPLPSLIEILPYSLLSKLSKFTFVERVSNGVLLFWFLHRVLRNFLVAITGRLWKIFHKREVLTQNEANFAVSPCPNRSYGRDLLTYRIFSARTLSCWRSLAMKTGGLCSLSCKSNVLHCLNVFLLTERRRRLQGASRASEVQCYSSSFALQ